MWRVLFSLFLSVWLAQAAAADDIAFKGGSDADAEEDGEDAPDLTDAEWYVGDVMVAIFYHELGHALIDVMDLPVLGLEEDAADVLSAVMIDRIWDAESAEAKVAAAANFWAASAMETAEAGYEPSFWGVHSPDERRYFTYLCLFYGGAPEAREQMAIEMGLPEDRAVTCPDEFDLASASWGVYLDELEAAGAGETLVWLGSEGVEDYVADAIREEVEYLNAMWSLPEPVGVRVAPCEEANAFYDPSEKAITMCSEMADYAMTSAP